METASLRVVDSEGLRGSTKKKTIPATLRASVTSAGPKPPCQAMKTTAVSPTTKAWSVRKKRIEHGPQQNGQLGGQDREDVVLTRLSLNTRPVGDAAKPLEHGLSPEASGSRMPPARRPAFAASLSPVVIILAEAPRAALDSPGQRLAMPHRQAPSSSHENDAAPSAPAAAPPKRAAKAPPESPDRRGPEDARESLRELLRVSLGLEADVPRTGSRPWRCWSANLKPADHRSAHAKLAA
jgi:hypothetical protein